MKNDKKFDNKQYMDIVDDIIKNKEFEKMESILHHGLSRKDHSIRVSYYSYIISKKLGLDYTAVARAGLLHDFFFEENEKSNIKKRAHTLVNHPKYARENASKYFSLSEKEADIIETHMFPVAIKMPSYIESWVVDIVDDFVAIGELVYNTKNKMAYAANFALILLLTYLR